MMFFVLATCVCLSALFVLLSATALLSWPWLRTAVLKLPLDSASMANLLFAARILPVFVALSVTLGLVLPAFLRFEPRSTGEAMSVKLLVLAAAGASVLLVMAVRGLRILRATVGTEKRWRGRSDFQLVNSRGDLVRVNFVSGSSPALLAVVGFFRPRIFVAKEVAAMLSPDELSAALAHELAHARFYDNLKQLLLKITRPPNWMGGTAVDSTWTGVSEVAADEAALAAGTSPLDLASALVKIVTLKKDGGVLNENENENALAASHLVPQAGCSSLAMRIERLQRALTGFPAESKIKSTSKRWKIAGAGALTLALYLAVFNTLLPVIHDALEFLVR